MEAVGSVVVTKTRLQHNLELVSVVWTSDASGNVSGNPFGVGSGPVQQVKFVPGTGGVQPTNGYNASVKDTDGCDVVINKGATLSNTTSFLGVQNAPLSWLTAQQLDVNISGAGNAKQGTVQLIIQRV